MKRLALFLCALCVLCGSAAAQDLATAEGLAAFVTTGAPTTIGGGPGDFSFVNQTTGAAIDGTAASNSVPIDITGAKLGVASVSRAGGAINFTNNQHDIWVPAFVPVTNGAWPSNQMFFCTNVTAAANYVCVEPEGGSFSVQFFTCSGTPVYNGHTQSGGNSTATFQPGTLTPPSGTNLFSTGLGATNGAFDLNSSFATSYGPGSEVLFNGVDLWSQISWKNSATAENPTWGNGASTSGTASMLMFGMNAGGGDDLTGISLRYVADDVTGSDGDFVSTWPDSGGGHMDELQENGGRQPVLKVNVVNSHRAVQFDGVSTVMTTNISPTLIGTATASAIFMVVKQTGSQAENCALNWEGSDVVSVYPSYDDVLYFYYKNNSSGAVSGSQLAGWDDAWHVVECHRNGANMSILVDGVSVATRSDASGNFTQTGTANLNLGARSSTGDVLFKGQIAEVRIYNLDKNSTTSANIRAALKATYGTP